MSEEQTQPKPMKIMFGVPFANDLCYHWFALSCATTHWPEASDLALCWPKGQVTPTNCNYIIKRGLEFGADWFVLAANDVGWHPNLIRNLIARDKDVIGPSVNARCHPHICGIVDQYNPETMMWRVSHDRLPDGTRKTGLERVAALHGGMFIIRGNVIRAISPPWFQFVQRNDFEVMTEDYYFCKKATEAGFEIWADWSENLMHATTGLVTKDGKVQYSM